MPQASNIFADVFYGILCCSSFLIGTSGNIVSFLYYKSKKRDISQIIYMMITINDILISIIILPIGISFLSDREPGLLLGNDIGCTGWVYLWYTTVSLSIFLVICLSLSRTISLLAPFRHQQSKHLIIAVAIYLVLQLILSVGYNLLDGAKIMFHSVYMRCDIYFFGNPSKVMLLILQICDDLIYVAPAFVVTISCIISAVLLTKRNESVDQRAQHRSRNRATVTILLFALLYGACNVPLVVDFILLTWAWFTEDSDWYFNVYKFDKQFYYYSAMKTLLLAANSAANPILYFWRIVPLREFTVSGIKKLLGLGNVPEVVQNRNCTVQTEVATITTTEV